MIDKEKIKYYIDKSILCWLATASKDGTPNVSPKEIFSFYGVDKIIIANIASPQTVKNIKQNAKVCVSFIDILVQKGLQLKGTAKIVTALDEGFEKMEHRLLKLTPGLFPFKSITEISISSTKPIKAPRYLLFPETTEQEQIESPLTLATFTN